MPIETHHLEKIITAYAEVDLGTPKLYSSTVEKVLGRGIEKMSLERQVEMARNLKRSTNVQAGGFGFFEAMEKNVHKQLHENKLGFPELCTLAENILANGIGSTEFQREVESFLLQTYTADNLQVVTDLLKGLSSYHIKTHKLEQRLYQTLHVHRDDFTVKQLETLVWALSR